MTHATHSTWVQKVPGAAAHLAYVVWPSGVSTAPTNPERTGYLGCVWQTTEGAPWFAVVGERSPIGLGPFPTLHAAHLEVRRAAIEARATALSVAA